MLPITLLHINTKTILWLCPRGEKRATQTESATDGTLAGGGQLGGGQLGGRQEVRASRHSGHRLAQAGFLDSATKLKSVGQFCVIPSFPSFCQLIIPQGRRPHGSQPVHALDSPEKK